MPKRKHQPPSYRRHKASGNAMVTIHGRDHYLGKYGSRESHEKYHELVAKWVATCKEGETGCLEQAVRQEDLRVSELLVAGGMATLAWPCLGGSITCSRMREHGTRHSPDRAAQAGEGVADTPRWSSDIACGGRTARPTRLITFGVTNAIEQVVDALKARGVSFDGPVKDDGPVRLANFANPDENVLCLCESR